MKIALIVAATLALLIVGYWIYTVQIANPRVVRELIEHPEGERAGRVMLLTLPSGRRIPVNYYRENNREDDLVYAGADGSWWKETVGDGHSVTVLVRGETLRGVARTVVDDPAYTKQIFKKLRPNAIEGFGRLVEIRLEQRTE
jgi:hypothetical protein